MAAAGGKEIVILPDTDLRGRQYADAVVALLAKGDPTRGQKSRSPDLPPGATSRLVEVVRW